MSGDKALPQVLVSVKDPDTIIHGAHEFRRVCNARRVLVISADGWDRWTCGGCGAYLHDGWRYCSVCGRRLQNPEEGDRAGGPAPRSCATCGHLERPIMEAPTGGFSGGFCDFEGEAVACSSSGVCGRWAAREEGEKEDG